MIKNIIFDMGNVLTIYNAREYIYGYVDNEEDFRWMKNHLCASVEWLQMDRGTITDDEAIASICRRMPEHLHSTVKRFINEYRMGFISSAAISADFGMSIQRTSAIPFLML